MASATVTPPPDDANKENDSPTDPNNSEKVKRVREEDEAAKAGEEPNNEEAKNDTEAVKRPKPDTDTDVKSDKNSGSKSNNADGSPKKVATPTKQEARSEPATSPPKQPTSSSEGEATPEKAKTPPTSPSTSIKRPKLDWSCGDTQPTKGEGLATVEKIFLDIYRNTIMSPTTVAVSDSSSMAQFKQRLATFSLNTWYWCGPLWNEGCSPLLCAQYGWSAHSYEILKCESCQQTTKPPTAFDQVSLGEWKNSLQSSHLQTCPYSVAKCPESGYTTFDTHTMCLEVVRQRYQQMLTHLREKSPANTFTIHESATESFKPHKPQFESIWLRINTSSDDENAAAFDPTTIEGKALVLVISGWAGSTYSQEAKIYPAMKKSGPIIFCDKCMATFGSVILKNGGEDGGFHPLQSHMLYCPYIKALKYRYPLQTVFGLPLDGTEQKTDIEIPMYKIKRQKSDEKDEKSETESANPTLLHKTSGSTELRGWEWTLEALSGCSAPSSHLCYKSNEAIMRFSDDITRPILERRRKCTTLTKQAAAASVLMIFAVATPIPVVPKVHKVVGGASRAASGWGAQGSSSKISIKTVIKKAVKEPAAAPTKAAAPKGVAVTKTASPVVKLPSRGTPIAEPQPTVGRGRGVGRGTEVKPSVKPSPAGRGEAKEPSIKPASKLSSKLPTPSAKITLQPKKQPVKSSQTTVTQASQPIKPALKPAKVTVPKAPTATVKPSTKPAVKVAAQVPAKPSTKTIVTLTKVAAKKPALKAAVKPTPKTTTTITKPEPSETVSKGPMPVPPKPKDPVDTLAEFRERMRKLSEKETTGKVPAKVSSSWGTPTAAAATPVTVKKIAAKAPAAAAVKKAATNVPAAAEIKPATKTDEAPKPASGWANSSWTGTSEITAANPFEAQTQPLKTFGKGVASKTSQPTPAGRARGRATARRQRGW